MRQTGVVSGALVTHERASVDEIAATGSDDARTDVSGLLAVEGVNEAFVLRTCNRAEAYVVAEDVPTGRAALSGFLTGVPEKVVRETGHEESLRHLMSVAAGLDSMVLGEDRVLGQVRNAYETARGVDGLGPVLDEAVTKAIHVGERVRTETGINDGTVSLSSAAAEFLNRTTDLSVSTGVVVGAGDVGSAAAEALAARGLSRLVVINRTVDNAKALCRLIEDEDRVDTAVEATGLDDLSDVLERADVGVVATGSDEPTIDVDTAADTDEIVLIDMGQPRDVAGAVNDLTGVTVYDLDAMEAMTDRTRQSRREAAETAREIVDAEFDRLLEQYKRKRADEVIAAMYESAERTKRHQLRETETKLGAAGEELTDRQREVVESMADAIVGQLLAAPTKSLRDAAAEDDWTTIATALDLFDPEFGPDAEVPSFVADEVGGLTAEDDG
jgi:glutamyl-tRNA reductase